MRVGLLVLELFLPGCSSLKEKRRVVKSLLDRVKSRYNAAAAETDHQELHQRSTLAFVSVASTEPPLSRLFDRIVDDAERLAPGCVREVTRELIG